MVTGAALGTYEMELTQELANLGVKAAQAKAKALGTPMSVSIVDKAARLVMFVRADGAGVFTPESTRGKAAAAAALRRRTSELGNYGGSPSILAIYAGLVPGGFWPAQGGSPIVHDGKVLGGVGCGGGSGEQDQECANAAAEAIAEAFARKVARPTRARRRGRAARSRR
ncbi:MAG: heme-binding protein [Chloroflexi bacterium]|nr:heme-binding protein [Chloroflexota bacterium]